MITSADVGATAFTQTRFRAGYSTEDVDAFLIRVRATLHAYEHQAQEPVQLSGVEVVNARFRPTNFRIGYDQDEVDDLLDQVVVALRTYEGAGKPTIL